MSNKELTRLAAAGQVPEVVDGNVVNVIDEHVRLLREQAVNLPLGGILGREGLGVHLDKVRIVISCSFHLGKILIYLLQL